MRVFDQNYLQGMLESLDNLEKYLDVRLDEFLSDVPRCHASAYQICLWSHWAKLLGSRFSIEYPALDWRDVCVKTWDPDWEDVWNSRSELPGLRQKLKKLIEMNG
jgi:uncharacterized protein with HEPN domain